MKKATGLIVSCCSLITKRDWWFYLEVSGQLLLHQLSSLSPVSEMETGSQLKSGTSSALGAWCEPPCFFPCVWSAWNLGNWWLLCCKHNGPIETCPSTICVAFRPLVGSSAGMEHQRLWDGKKQFHCLSAPHVLLFVFSPKCSSV